MKENETGKGKEVERERRDQNRHLDATSSGSGTTSSDNSDARVESVWSRLASSTADLVGGSISGSAQSANLSTSGKAESSSIAGRPETALRETTRVTHPSSSNAISQLGTTFRSPAGHGDTGSSSASSHITNEDIGNITSGIGINSISQRIVPGPVTDAAVAASRDGSEVVDLLDAVATADEDIDEIYMTDDELLPLRKTLFGEGMPTGTNWDSALNFVPEFLLDRGMDRNNDHHQQLAQHLGTSNTVEARTTWFAEWDNVLSSYTDEVWGDLNPLVKAARQELETLSITPEGTTSNDLTALRRLQQILAHIRGPS
ncbi:hypothetical protein F4808DRAFT_306699 [Astrocystis sublimbata]|nr:hypothetical protein F4808DRAFT_306699 [Astrocystis sublimbata]